MSFVDYYKILGVSKDIPQKDVRAAYRKRAKQFHPDLHPNDPKAKAKFQALSEAYEVIGDPDKRAKYDQYGAQWRSADAFQGFGGRGGFNPNGGGSPFEGFDFSNFGGGFSSFFQDLFGGGGGRTQGFGGFSRQAQQAATAPCEQEMVVNIDLYTALLGGEIVITLPQGKKIKLKVKPNTQNGTKMRVRTSQQGSSIIIRYNVQLPTTLTAHQQELLKRMRDDR